VNEIKNIITQVQSTQIRIGHVQGRYISDAQINRILDCLEQLMTYDNNSVTGTDSDLTPTESNLSVASSSLRQTTSLSDRAVIIRNDIRLKEIELACASKDQRTRVNLELGVLRSEASRVAKAIQKLSSP
jgi:hypothetical protein